MSVSVLSLFAQSVFAQKYSLDGETWAETATRVATSVMGALGYGARSNETERIERYVRERKFLPGGRYLYAAGRPLHQVCNCLLLRAEDSREGWGELWRRAGMALLTGAGVGVEYSHVRPRGSPISRTGGEASGPCSLMHTVNEIGRQVMQGGSRRSAVWAGLSWRHPDALDFLRVKDWSPELRSLRASDPLYPAPMELTNVSVELDGAFFEAVADARHPLHGSARDVYRESVRRMCRTGEPGLSVDVGAAEGETLRNACTEVTSTDSDDVCNLGSVNLARVGSLEEMRDVVDAGVLFLLAGSAYTDLPYPEVSVVRDRNRRLGLGLMGVHEWLLRRGRRYGPDPELGEWMDVYARSTDVAARRAEEHSLSVPVKTRAVAPTGTIGIVAETTTGIEPVYSVAYRRRYLRGSEWRSQYVVDPTVRRLVRDGGVDPEGVEDAYALALDPERRVGMQAWVQRYVDHGISSTVNLPRPLDEDEADAFGGMLLRYLPALRGITAYPAGARGADPLEPADYRLAARRSGTVYREHEHVCSSGTACGA